MDIWMSVNSKITEFSWPADWQIVVRPKDKSKKRKSKLVYPWLRKKDGKMILTVEQQ
jgi:hypothetical protein